jgi:hypothetical protein
MAKNEAGQVGTGLPGVVNEFHGIGVIWAEMHHDAVCFGLIDPGQHGWIGFAVGHKRKLFAPGQRFADRSRAAQDNSFFIVLGHE